MCFPSLNTVSSDSSFEPFLILPGLDTDHKKELYFNQLGNMIQLVLSSLMIRLKCLLQELWLRKLSWDDELPPDIHAVWSQWWLELPFLSELKDSAKDPRFQWRFK
ncbi:hypothetical protein TNCV_1516451 [Trichonephila clavipes]|nr:hypothetical protein TNCV_1516451 [Trichonephila clavipes]